MPPFPKIQRFKFKGWCRPVDRTSTFLSTVNRKFGWGTVWQFGNSGNEPDMLQLQVEIRVTPGILETHFLREDLIVLTSMRTTKTVCCKWHDYDPYISRHWFLDICWLGIFAHLIEYYKSLKTVTLSFNTQYMVCTYTTECRVCLPLETVTRQEIPIQVGVWNFFINIKF